MAGLHDLGRGDAEDCQGAGEFALGYGDGCQEQGFAGFVGLGEDVVLAVEV